MLEDQAEAVGLDAEALGLDDALNELVLGNLEGQTKTSEVGEFALLRTPVLSVELSISILDHLLLAQSLQ